MTVDLNLGGVSTAQKSALSGLQLVAKEMAVRSNNVVNSATPGYSAKRVDQANRIIGAIGAGVEINSITRNVDAFLTRKIREQQSIISDKSVKNETYEQLEQILGQPGASNTLSYTLNEWTENMKRASNTPEENTYAEDVVTASKKLVQQIRQTSEMVQTLRGDSDAKIASVIDLLNKQIENVRELNFRIAAGYIQGDDISNLEDRMDSALQEMAKYIDIRALVDGDKGYTSVYFGNGIPLVIGNVSYPLSFSAAPSVVTTSTYPTSLSGVFSRSRDVSRQIGGGQLRGLLDLRDTDLPEIQGQMDLLTNTMLNEVNKLHNLGSTYAGDSTISGNLSFAALTTPVAPINHALSGIQRFALVDSKGNLIKEYHLDLGTVPTTLPATEPTIGDLINSLNTLFGGDITASLSNGTNGTLTLTSNNPLGAIAMGSINGQAAPMGDAGKGFSHYFGFHDFFITRGNTVTGVGVSNTIDLDPKIAVQNRYFCRGRLSQAANLTPGNVAIANSDNTNVSSIIAKMSDATLNFVGIGSISTTVTSILSYSEKFISAASVKIANNRSNSEVNQLLLDEFELRAQETSSVDLNEEMQRVIQSQQMYNAAVMVLTTTNEMLDQLEKVLS